MGQTPQCLTHFFYKTLIINDLQIFIIHKSSFIIQDYPSLFFNSSRIKAACS
jgi:hypothetical protein